MYSLPSWEKLTHKVWEKTVEQTFCDLDVEIYNTFGSKVPEDIKNKRRSLLQKWYKRRPTFTKSRQDMHSICSEIIELIENLK